MMRPTPVTNVRAFLTIALLMPALLVACSDNNGRRTSFGAGVVGSTSGAFTLTISVVPNNINKGGSGGITVLAQTLNGAPIVGRQVQMATSGGTVEPSAGTTDAAGKFVSKISIPEDYAGPNPIDLTAVVDSLVATVKVNINDLGALTIVPSGPLTLAPGDTQFLNCVGGVPPYRWEASGGTLNISSGPQVIFTAGTQVGTFFEKCTDAAGNAASVQITISLTAGGLALSPSGNLALNPGQVQVFRASGGRPPYQWTATGGTPTSGSGDTFTYTAGKIPGVFTVSLRDSTGQTLSAQVTIAATPLTFGPNMEISVAATGGAPGACSVTSVSAKITATGGVPPYSFVAAVGTVTAISPPAADSSPTTITYASPAVSGIGGGSSVVIDTVTVVDATGTRKDVTVTVKCAAVPAT